MMDIAERIGGKDNGFKFIQVPIGVMMPEALVENWQHFVHNKGVADEEQQMKPLVSVCNLLRMNIMVSKPVLEGGVRDTKIETIKNIEDPVAKHLQLVRSMPPRCIISTMCGMKSIENLKKNFEVIKNEPLSK